MNVQNHLAKVLFITACLLLGLQGCRTTTSVSTEKTPENAVQEKKTEADSVDEFVIAFGSCNRVDRPNQFWDDIAGLEPDLWIWGGDNIYADTDDMDQMEAMYVKQQNQPDYALLARTVPVIGTWDDHDYGLNDGGIEFKAKKASQQLLLDFLGVPEDSPRRKREGVYALHEYQKGKQKISVFVLDTRYFRTPLTKGSGKKRYEPSETSSQSMLGDEQWAWLEEGLNASTADFNIIVSSIQFLSNQHGFEKWANMPTELKKMENLIQTSGAKGVIFLSGDRHISEFSRKQLDGMPYPLWDFTSSGMTHSYSGFSGEPNPYRIGEVESGKSFGVLRLRSEGKSARFEIRGDEGRILHQEKQAY